MKTSVILPSIALVSFLSFYSCSPRESAFDLPKGLREAELRVDVFSARGFLGGSEYERYFLKDSMLWRECGTVALPKKKAKKFSEKIAESGDVEGDQVFEEDSSLEITERRVEKLSPDEMASLKIRAKELAKAVTAGKKRPPLPGSFYSLAEPGLLELKVSLNEEETRVVTSVDAVADGESVVESRMRSLLERLRGVGPEICGASTFYGIGRIIGR